MRQYCLQWSRGMANETKSITFCRRLRKKQKQIFPGRRVAGHSCWQECSCVSLLFSQEIMAVKSYFNKSTETFFNPSVIFKCTNIFYPWDQFDPTNLNLYVSGSLCLFVDYLNTPLNIT